MSSAANPAPLGLERGDQFLADPRAEVAQALRRRAAASRYQARSSSLSPRGPVTGRACSRVRSAAWPVHSTSGGQPSRDSTLRRVVCSRSRSARSRMGFVSAAAAGAGGPLDELAGRPFHDPAVGIHRAAHQVLAEARNRFDHLAVLPGGADRYRSRHRTRRRRRIPAPRRPCGCGRHPCRVPGGTAARRRTTARPRRCARRRAARFSPRTPTSDSWSPAWDRSAESSPGADERTATRRRAQLAIGPGHRLCDVVGDRGGQEGRTDAQRRIPDLLPAHVGEGLPAQFHLERRGRDRRRPRNVRRRERVRQKPPGTR